MDRYNLVKNIVGNIENGVFVEIGTHRGQFADHILNSSKNSVLYCIDPYICYDQYDDAINNITGDDLFNTTSNNLKSKYGERIVFIRKFSKDAIHDIPNNIDFLYIDGNHRYTYVYKDLELYYPKVKKNGYVIGDDAVDHDETKRNENGDIFIEWCPGFYGHYGVIKAFTEFSTVNCVKGEIIGNQYQIKKIEN